MTRTLFLAFVLLIALPGAAAASSVGGTMLDGAAIRAEAARLQAAEMFAAKPARQAAFDEHARRAWVRGELALAGISVPEQVVARAQARERRVQGSGFAETLHDERMSESVWREKVRANVERRILFDHFYRRATDDGAYERVFLDWAARWRSQTTCDATYAGAEACGGTRRRRDACDVFGPVDVCFYPGRSNSPAFWSIFEDVSDALGVFNNSEAQDLLEPRLRRARPSLARLVEFDSEADFLGVSAQRRRPLVGVARFIHRLTLRRPTAPVLLPPE